MRKYIYLFCLTILVLSCTSDNYFISEDPTPPETDELVALSFGCGGELVNVVSSPMTKAGSSDDLYLFMFWENNPEVSQNWTNYGYIFTDNPATCRMSFRKNKTYICNALCVPEGKKVIESCGNHYGYPFNTPYDGFLELNKTYYGQLDLHFSYPGIATPKGCSINALPFNYDKSNEWNSIEQYFGIKKFIAENDAKIDINLYRMMYSITLNITNFTEGKITIFDKYEIKPKDIPYTKIFELSQMSNDIGIQIDAEDYDEFLNNYSYDFYDLNLKYIDKKGNTTLLYKGGFNIKRLTNYDISFDLEQILANDNMGIETNLQNEDITDSGSISL